MTPVPGSTLGKLGICLAPGTSPFGATFCLWAILCWLLTMEGMEVFLILGLFLVVYFLVLPRIPWLSRFT